MKVVESSNIARVGYGENGLRIEFKGKKGNATYDYLKAKVGVYVNLLAAESKGKFFAKNIQGVYVSVKRSPSELVLEDLEIILSGAVMQWGSMNHEDRQSKIKEMIGYLWKASKLDVKG